MLRSRWKSPASGVVPNAKNGPSPAAGPLCYLIARVQALVWRLARPPSHAPVIIRRVYSGNFTAGKRCYMCVQLVLSGGADGRRLEDLTSGFAGCCSSCSESVRNRSLQNNESDRKNRRLFLHGLELVSKRRPISNGFDTSSG
jgi:hypothetical protein